MNKINKTNDINNNENLTNSLFDFAQVKQYTLDPVKLRQNRIVTLQQDSAEADVFKILRTKILKHLRKKNWNSFAITAPTQGVGKTMVSINLAIAMAMDTNQSVLLIDMDLVNPSIDLYLDLNVEYGLKDYLISNIPLSKIVIDPGIDRLLIIPGKGRVIESSEILSAEKMRNLINKIKTENPSKIIIFDLPPVLASDDVLVSTEYYDAALIIFEEGGNRPEEIARTMQLLSGIPLLGTVLNKAEHLPGIQHYSYGYSYKKVPRK